MTTTLRFFLFITRLLIVLCITIVSNGDCLYSQEKEEEGDDEQEQLWNVSSGGHFYSRYTSYGIELSENKSAASIESEISHQSGIRAGVEAFAVTGTNGGYEHSSIHGGYEYSFSSLFRLNGVYTYHSYRTDSLNVLAGISNELSIAGTLTLGKFALTAAFTTFFGGGNASYGTLGASTQIAIGKLSITPTVQLSIASQTVDETLLPKNKGQGQGNSKKPTAASVITTTTISGVSNVTASAAFRYPIGKGFTASLVPAYVYSPTDLAITTSQLILTIGIEHSIDF